MSSSFLRRMPVVAKLGVPLGVTLLAAACGTAASTSSPAGTSTHASSSASSGNRYGGGSTASASPATAAAAATMIKTGTGSAGTFLIGGIVKCQLVGKDGRITTVGSFRLKDGYGSWGSSYAAANGSLAGARLITPDGTVLATASFSAA